MVNSISFIIPCYNEHPKVLQKTVEELSNSLKTSGWEYEILVVNDGSKKYKYPKISGARVINHMRNRGYGSSLKTGINHSKYEWIGITDADGTYPNKSVNKFFPFTKDYDMIIGKRNTSGIPFLRRIPKAVLNPLASFIAREHIPDLNSGLRIFKKDMALKFWNMYPAGFSFTSTITVASMLAGYDVKYININYFKRKGKSSINPIKDTVRFFSLLFRLLIYFNPQRFFLPLSLVFILLGILRGIRDLLVQNSFGGLTLIIFILAMQVFFFGLLADIIIKRS